jgi:hypothetical protein
MGCKALRQKFSPQGDQPDHAGAQEKQGGRFRHSGHIAVAHSPHIVVEVYVLIQLVALVEEEVPRCAEDIIRTIPVFVGSNVSKENHRATGSTGVETGVDKAPFRNVCIPQLCIVKMPHLDACAGT